MKFKREFSPLSLGRKGSALVLVLASLAFLAALTLAFLASVRMELASSKRYSDGVASNILAQSAFNLAAAQIREATKGYPSENQNLIRAWASQPGMIRTYDAAGNQQEYFKLYSWDQMTGTGSFDAALEKNSLTGWHDSKAVFVDLNEPLQIGGKKSYPIIDGDIVNMNIPAWGGSVKTYNNDADNTLPDVEGFYVKGAPLDANISNEVPMPVKWLYVLADGRIEAPGPDSSGNEAVIGAADDDNPIVGRVAFWVDDETCKVNVNTASNGTYWDAPKGSSAYESNLASFQPAQHEYQRYPGHPAMTSLRAVFPTLTSEEIYQIAPRIIGGAGSSLGGTVDVHGSNSPDLVTDADRLYASVDELLFRPARSENHPVLDQASLERAKFFLTSSSRAPDLNLFNRPRVSIWPLHRLNDAFHRTAFDNLIAFCSTVNGKSFSFVREFPQSATADLPPPPASSGDTGLQRNRYLLDYLRFLTGQSIPGFGGNFASKYNTSNGAFGTDRDQILTQIFDYIRCSNLDDATVKQPYNQITDTVKNVGQGQASPIHDTATGTRGFGRFPTVQGASLVFCGLGTNTATPVLEDDNTMAANMIRVKAMLFVNLFTPSQGVVQMRGNYRITVEGLDGLQWESWDKSGAALGMMPMGFTPGPLTITPQFFAVTTTSNANVWGVHSVGGSSDVKAFSWTTKLYKLMSGKNYMPQGGAFKFGGGTLKVTLSSSDSTVLQTVQLNFPPAVNPQELFPVPALAPDKIGGSYRFRILDNNQWCRIAGTGDYAGNTISKQDVVRSIVPAGGDLRLAFPRTEIKVTDADYASFYMPHDHYLKGTAAGKKMAHSLRTEDNTPYYGATGGRLLQLAYKGWKNEYLANSETAGLLTDKPVDSPVIPSTQSTSIFGDWDNGIGHTPDGPYINKADEGDVTNPLYPTQKPYFGWTQKTPITSTLFSPNRMMPSAVMFGSLPTGVWARVPWQTLLFCPNPLLPTGGTHKGAGLPASGPPYTTPPDHLLLDLFHMPVVEPYAISEPLSTAGRINMNYQIVPFTYINRSTGLNAVLKAEKVIAFANADAGAYKRSSTFSSSNARFDIDVDETLQGFEARFAQKDIFRSPSEICGIGLVPQGVTKAGLAAYWQTHQLTGDNSRERPYATIYPRLTTKSNTFTIHVRVQSLQKIRSTDPGVWTEGRDVVTGEYRGSQIIERYVDPNDPRLPDYANPSVGTPISNFYKTRVLSTKQFAP